MSETRESRWRRALGRLENPGLSRRQERALNGVLAGVLLLFTAGWTVVIAGAAGGDERLMVGAGLTANPLSPAAPPPAAALTAQQRQSAGVIHRDRAGRTARGADHNGRRRGA